MSSSNKVALRILIWQSVLLGLLLSVTTVAQINAIDLDDSEKLIVMVSGKFGNEDTIGAGIVFGHGENNLYIATANHVVRKGLQRCEDIIVQFKFLPGETFKASLLPNVDHDLDLSLLKVVGIRNHGIRTDELPFDRLGNSGMLKLEDTVFAVGYPNGRPWYVNTFPERISAKRGNVFFDFQTIFIAIGHSGGGLFDDNGKLVGLITAHDMPEGRAVGIDAVLDTLRQWGYPVNLHRQSSGSQPDIRHVHVATIHVGTAPSDLEVTQTPNGERVYVLTRGPTKVIDTVNNYKMSEIPVGGTSTGIAITPDGNKAFIADYGDGRIRVVDTTHNQVIDSWYLEYGLTDLAFAWEFKHLVVTSSNIRSNKITALDTRNGEELYSVPVGSQTNSLVGTGDGWIYATSFFTNEVHFVSARNFQLVESVPVGEQPTGIALSPEGEFLYVANSGSDSVSVIATSDKRVVETISVGESPVNVVITRNGKWAYVVNSESDSVSVIDTGTKAVVTEFLAGTRPSDAAIDRFGRFIYIANSGSSTVDVFKIERDQ